ncbi:FadR/GntR family transcriptional regulator [Draconibacterium sediminis]|uniref:GntR family transcriptional regulator n=1 Tax=Draconibacterium sediminis TaxID=1544798 RepID=A0A0D8J7A1_9BACT|nr:GntR family transcriptional regulator [Draconibacterium sediminis]KJF42840.1 GntR family transcriptional regulator [Draconibacterium sediminis]
MTDQNLINQIPLIDTSSLVDKVEMQLLEIFITKGLKTGDKIPKELELASAMGVSRTVIRESLTRLKAMGLVDSIKHKGTILTSPNLAQILQKSMIPKVLDDETLKNIFEIRLILEIGMADSIFKNITEADILELEQITNSEPESTGDVLFDIDHEIMFHGKLYEITNNYTLKSFQTILLPVFNFVYDSGLINRPIKKKKHVSHKELVEILKNGNPKKFREGMRKHLDNHFNRLFE